jgi:hypothetical protein
VSGAGLDRRAALGLLAASGATLAVSTPLGANATTPGLGQATVLMDARFRAEEIQVIRRAMPAMLSASTVVPLDAHVVRQWQRSIGALLRRSSGLQALTRWDSVTLLKGLAREHGFQAAYRQLGSGIFHTRLTVRADPRSV